MGQPLHILFVEDNAQDTELVLRELRRAGYEPYWSRVETAETFLAHLNPNLEIILSDFMMPQFTGLQALRLLGESKLEIPFIIVSGTIGEDTAVEAMKLGATDYLLKDRLARLGTAVQRALEQQRANHQRKVAVEALRESETRLRQMMENIHEVIWLTNPAKSCFLYISPAYENIWGRSRDLLYKNALGWLESIYPEDRGRIHSAALIKQVLGDYNETYRIVRPDGTLRWIRDRAYPMRDDTGQVTRLVGVAEDITEQKQLEEKFLQTQRMEAIGTLAGGIAHDFNNILSGIVGYNSLARQAATGNPELIEYLDEISRAGSRAADLVRQILAFSRTDTEALVPIQLRHTVAEAVQLLRAAIPSTIKFEVNLSSNMPAVLGNATQLHQVVMNLGTNASHAMRERPGQLIIQLDTCLVDEALSTLLPDLPPGPYVRLTVRDNGCGMDTATQKRVFEPFFTTKRPGEGSGLGLSVAHGIVRNHHGAIRLSSDVARGTTFEIYLPAIAATPLPVMNPEESGAIPRGKGEAILFVDDEMILVRLGVRILCQLGYAAIGECEPWHALARLEREPQAFKLIITDQTMPELTGLEFAQRIRAIRSDLPVILMSGHGIALTSDRIQASGICDVLAKPFSAETLAQAVRRHLPPPPPT